MNVFADELVAISRHFGLFERDAVCCGTVTVQQCVALQALLAPAAPHPRRTRAGDEPGFIRAGAAPGNDEGHDITSLAAHMGVTKSAATRLVDGMEKRGWVARIRGSRDRRRVLVQHTEAGRKEALRLQQLTLKSVRAVMDHIPAEAHADVLRAMKLVRVALDKARVEGALHCKVDNEMSCC